MSAMPNPRLARRLAIAAAAVVVTLGPSAAFARSGSASSGGQAPAAPAGCPTTNQTVAVSGPNGTPAPDDYRSNASATNFDLGTGVAAAHFPVESNSTQDVQSWLNKTAGTGNDCWSGGVMSGDNLKMTWSQLKACCNAWFWAAGQGSGAEPKSETWVQVTGNDPDEDAFHLLGVTPAYTILDSQITNVRDECFSTAHDNLTVDGTYCSGWTIVSWRNTGGGTGAAFKVNFNDDVFWLKKQLGGAETSCPDAGGGGYDHGIMWKMDTFHGSGSDITATNSVWRVDSNETNSSCLKWPTGSYSGDTVVYTGTGSYKGQLPKGVTLSTNISTWYTAVDNWCSTHWPMNYTSQSACDTALDN